MRAGPRLLTCLRFVAGEGEASAEADHHESAADAHAGEAFRVAGEPSACGACGEGPCGVAGEGDREGDQTEGRHLEGDGSVVVVDELGEHCDQEDNALGLVTPTVNPSRRSRKEDGRVLVVGALVWSFLWRKAWMPR